MERAVRANKRRKRSVSELKQAYCELLQTDDASKIKVKDIYTLAHHSHMSFYNNFENLDDFVDKILDDEVIMTLSLTQRHYTNWNNCSSEQQREEVVFDLFNSFYEYVYHNQQIYTAILCKNILPHAESVFCNKVFERMQTEITSTAWRDDFYCLQNRIVIHTMLYSVRFWIDNHFALSPYRMATHMCNILDPFQAERLLQANASNPRGTRAQQLVNQGIHSYQR